MSDAPELLPCPFCGNSAIVRSSVIPGRGFCEECGAEGPWSPYFEGDWNTRAPDPRVAALVEAASDLMQRLHTTRGTGRISPIVETVLDRLDAALAAFKGSDNG